MRFIKKLFAKTANPIQEAEAFVQCGECSLSQKQYPFAQFFYEVIDTSKILCESCYEKKTSHGECSCVTYNEEKDEWEEAPKCCGDCEERSAVWDYYQYWRRLPRPKIDYGDQPQVIGFILMHHRYNDSIVFGPFKTIEELRYWCDTIGRPHGVGGSIRPIMNPHGDPADFWYIPNDMPWSETLKPKKERGYIP